MVCALISVTTLPSGGEEVLRLGPVYPIVEPDWREWIPKQVERKLSHDPAWWRRRLEEAIRRQTPQWDLPEVKIPSTRIVDPTVTAQRPLFDRSGRWNLAPVKVNPLDAVPLSRPILILDGRKERQVELARRSSKQPMIIMIVAGDPFSLGRVLGRPVYPAPKEIFQKFEIGRVPVLIRQEKERIKIEEVVP